MSNYAVIRPLQGMEQLAQNQWIRALTRLGHTVSVHALRSPNIDPRENLPRLVSEVLKNRPEIIFVEGALGFNLIEFFQHASIREIPVVAFWFDDPLRAVEWRKNQKDYLDTLRLKNVHHFVWDGYWRDWLKRKYAIGSYPIHLAADPGDFRPQDKINYPDHVVFVGTFVSPQHIAKKTKELPPLFEKLIPTLKNRIEEGRYGALTYQILDDVVLELPQKLKSAFEQLVENSSDAILHLRSIAWMLGKNEVRKRVLKQALKVAPLLILSGNLEKTHANEEEIREILLESSDRLQIQNTGSTQMQDLGSLYAFGKLHIQATDPQSVEGGIPFRVFQTTASRRPLLTDTKPELAECYQYEKELLTYNSNEDFSEKLAESISRKDLHMIAEAGHQRFLKEHTWESRLRGIRDKVFHL